MASPANQYSPIVDFYSIILYTVFMERLPLNRPLASKSVWQHLPYLYVARSIADLMGSHDQVSDDNYMRLQSFEEPTRSIYKIQLMWDRLFTGILGKPYRMPALCGIYLPRVRHDPEQDIITDHATITLRDPTGSCEVRMPNFLYSNQLRAAGKILPVDSIRKHPWCSDVLIEADYNNWGDKYTLLQVFNRTLNEEERAALPFLIPNSNLGKTFYLEGALN